MEWTWNWIPYGGHASFGDNFWFDWLRVLCLVGGVILVFVVGRVLAEGARREVRMPWTQSLRFIALVVADVYICGTEFAVFGTPATPRIAVAVMFLLAAIFGVRGMRRKQRATPPIR